MQKTHLFFSLLIALVGVLVVGAVARGDAVPEVGFVADTVRVAESDPSVQLDVTLSQSSTLTTTVRYETRDGSAVGGQDFISTTGTLTFTPGITLRIVSVSLLNDHIPEQPESFSLVLSHPVSVTLGLYSTATITIADDGDPYLVQLPLVLQYFPPIPFTPILSGIENSDGDGDYAVTWVEQPTAFADIYILQEATNTGFSEGVREVCSTPDQRCDVTGRVAGTYYYRVKGRNNYGESDWSNVHSATVLPPDTPILDGIENSDGDGSYVVNWHPVSRATTYVLQHDTSSTFENPTNVYEGPEDMWSGTVHSWGSHYYRVQAWGPTGHSEWSNMHAAVVEATPHNPNAQSLTLSLSDMPSGYSLDQEESGPFGPSDAIAGGYQVQYEDYDRIFYGTPIVANIAEVFRTAELAWDFVQRMGQSYDADPDYDPISSPTYGDETRAYRSLTTEDGYDFVAYVIFFRKDNVVEAVFTVGLLGAAEFDDALSYAEILLDKVNAQISAYDAPKEFGMNDTDLGDDTADLDILLPQMIEHLSSSLP